MKHLLAVLIISVVVMTSILAQPIGSKVMYLKVNGNSYQKYDLLADTIKSIFRTFTDSIKNVAKEEIRIKLQQSGQFFYVDTCRFLCHGPESLNP